MLRKFKELQLNYLLNYNPWLTKGIMLMSTLIWACCVFGDLVVDVTTRTNKILLIYFFMLLKFVVLVFLEFGSLVHYYITWFIH